MTEGFAAIPNWIIRDVPELTVYDIAVYVALSTHTGHGGITPSHPTIAREARCSERQARKALKHLEELGLIGWEQQRTRTRGQTSNRYILLPHGEDYRHEVPPPPAQHAAPPGTPDRGAPARGADEEEPLEEEPMKKSSSHAKTKPHPMPEGWKPNEGHQEYARQHGLSVFDEYGRFAAWAEANGKEYVNWDAGFRTWLMKAKDYGRGRAGTPPIGHGAGGSTSAPLAVVTAVVTDEQRAEGRRAYEERWRREQAELAERDAEAARLNALADERHRQRNQQ